VTQKERMVLLCEVVEETFIDDFWEAIDIISELLNEMHHNSGTQEIVEITQKAKSFVDAMTDNNREIVFAEEFENEDEYDDYLRENQ
jgi:hypothetical protein